MCSTTSRVHSESGLQISVWKLTVGLLLLSSCFLGAAIMPQAGCATNVSRFGIFPSWSPDSRRVVFSNTNSPGLWVSDLTTGETRHIYPSGNFPAWNPKGDQIAFRNDRHLWFISPDGTKAVDKGVVVGNGIRWSPDGKYMVAYDNAIAPHDHLFLFDTNNWTRTELSFARIGPRKKVGSCWWTPEGNLIVTPPVGQTGSWQSNEVREFSLSGKLIRRITLRGFSAKPFDANVSPDGLFIIFHRGSRGIWMANRDGTDVRQISQAGAAAAWSPDGRCIAYDDSSSWFIYKNGIFLLELKPPSRL